jgi:hypothetical protein
MGVTSKTTVQFLSRKASVESFTSAVSLHSHTMHSEESLEVIPHYAARVPYLSKAIRRSQLEHLQKHGRPFHFGTAFWTPPLAPRQAYRLEEKQINRKLQLPALISLTDHDDIRAGALLRVMDRFRSAPISLEWTIPFGPTFFHLGIHNLPEANASSIFERLRSFSGHPVHYRLPELLEMLYQYGDVLVVLNHPLWDEKRIGVDAHRETLQQLLEKCSCWIHALELNGLRSRDENRQVLAFARKWDIPAISGGERHGREPNAILNLSYGSTFEAFVHEIRRERVSRVLFMPQYREPLKLRVLQTILDIVRDYPENAPGRRSWTDRIFYRNPETGEVLAYSDIWKHNGPRYPRHVVRAVKFLEWRGVRSALRLALSDEGSVWADPEAQI